MSPDPDWVRRTDVALRPDRARVVSALFLPGQETVTAGESRSAQVVERVLALSDDDVAAELDELARAFDERHRDLRTVWAEHFALVEHRVPDPRALGAARRLLVGAAFTHEVAIEGAALCNPSIVPHPDQAGLAPGATRFVLTLRAVAEGHVSGAELRAGTIDAAGSIMLDAAPRFAVRADARPASYSRAGFEHQLDDFGGDLTNARFVLASLGDTFDRDELDRALAALREQKLTRGAAVRTIELFERMADCSYAVEFPPDSALAERVLLPRGPAESHGIEDVRMVRFDSGEYVGTYSAYDGYRVYMQMLRTWDFVSFTATALSGPGTRDKGLALFPRAVGGRHLALARAGRESNGVCASADLLRWDEPVPVQRPEQGWEAVQLGNCGSPIETEQGWLVLTHGVGPMRVYSIGAVLLDLEDPTVVVGRLRRPLLTPAPDERSGYVPNVVYSCGAMVHGRTLVLPYGRSDTTTGIALVDLDALLTELRTGAPSTKEDR
ncbi:glycoside hydrolase family 130 protein [Cellulomonas sp. JH27-2]|uniref:glycoside hydrolase family 130 protein n=1 Tax=Cellulomonas sp. JH27-2 TaxID=2774139 RepID=UPI0017800E7B|nr:glycoside hydrolase family 130 protein [Cellulomonas sp. JH27-2]MBD8060227.1 glycoside hydrolase family 130 protein [Cellulomonas sp. JH27-2]